MSMSVPARDHGDNVARAPHGVARRYRRPATSPTGASEPARTTRVIRLAGPCAKAIVHPGSGTPTAPWPTCQTGSPRTPASQLALAAGSDASRTTWSSDHGSIGNPGPRKRLLHGRRDIRDQDRECQPTTTGAQGGVDRRPRRAEAGPCDPLVVDRDQFDVSGVDAPCRVAGADAGMLSARLDGEAQALVGLRGCIQIRDPVHEMVELHSHILLPRHRCECQGSMMVEVS